MAKREGENQIAIWNSLLLVSHQLQNYLGKSAKGIPGITDTSN